MQIQQILVKGEFDFTLQIVEKLKEMNRTYDNADLLSLGKSHEGRQMYAIKVCTSLNSYTHT